MEKAEFVSRVLSEFVQWLGPAPREKSAWLDAMREWSAEEFNRAVRSENVPQRRASDVRG